MSKYHILSLDGGGIRGVITVILMQRLLVETGLETWLDEVDLLAGTSTGGLLSLGIAKGLDLKVIRNLYESKGKIIFDDNWLDDLVDLATVVGAEYDNKNLKRELLKIFENDKLGDLERSVLITAFDLDNEHPDSNKRSWKPKLFHNIPTIPGESNDADDLVYKVALYTAAAPTYFPVVDGYIDGGVYANNPSMCALAQTQDRRNQNTPPLSDVVLLSLGTGKSLNFIKRKQLDWGYAQWVKPLITLVMDGVGGIADYQCRQMLRSRYHRLAPVFPPGVSISMDDVERVPDMIEFAKQVDLSDTIAWMKVNWF
jgi:patatin-like phospholipase/acyl hydrolase